MNTILQRRRCRLPSNRSSSAGCGTIENLERRTLLSASWSTVDDFKELTYSAAIGITTDSAGDVFAAGAVTDNTQTTGVVRKSTDAGATWPTTLQDSAANFVEVRGVAVSSDGNTIFLVGCAKTTTGTSNWIVRRSNDGGQTWATADQFTLGGSGNTRANAITSDTAGNLYVVGQADAGSNHLSWIVRRSQDGGTTWSTVDTISGGAAASYANSVFVSPTGNIFVAGLIPGGKKGTIGQWTVRRSQDGGNTWSTVDSYQLNTAYDADATSLGTDAAGNLYAVGWADTRGSASLGVDHWTVRKSSNGGTTWTTVDDFPAQSGQSRPAGFAKDSLGNLYVVGQNSHNWVVRSNPLGQGAWSTADTFQLSASGAAAAAIVADGTGHVFVAGSAVATDGSTHWIVRETSVAPAAVAPLSTSATAMFSSVSINGGNAVGGDLTLASPSEPLLSDQFFGHPTKRSHAHGR